MWCSQKSTAETSVARQRLVGTHFRGNEYTCINQRFARRLTHVSWQPRITEQSTVRLGVLYSVRMKLILSEIQTARESADVEELIFLCTYDVWVYNKSIHQSEPRLQVTNTRDNNVPFDCGRCFIDETGRPWEACIKEHRYNLTQGLLEKSKLARYACHQMYWKEGKFLQTELR
jgi:hypothetical protein